LFEGIEAGIMPAGLSVAGAPSKRGRPYDMSTSLILRGSEVQRSAVRSMPSGGTA
jgi:hypothetical protein